MNTQHAPALLALAVTAAFAGTPARADETPFFSYSIGGFGTLAASRTNTEHAEFRPTNYLTSGASTNWEAGLDTVAGVQGTLNFGSRVSAVVQLLSRRNEENGFDPRVDWAYLSWRATDDLTLRAGRFVAPVFMLSASRNVGFSNTWVRPPMEVYNMATVNNVDGIDVMYAGSYGAVDYRLQGYAGQFTVPFDTNDLEYHFMAGLAATAEYKSLTARISYLASEHSLYDNEDGSVARYSPGIRLRDRKFYTADGKADSCFSSALSQGLSCEEIFPGFNGVADKYDRDHSPFNIATLGTAYDDGIWAAQAEWAYRYSPSLLSNSVAWYASLGRRFGSFTPYVTYGWRQNITKRYRLTASDEAEAVLFNPAMVLQPTTANLKQRTWTLGTRYDVSRNLALKLQADYIEPVTTSFGEHNGSGLSRVPGAAALSTYSPTLVWTVAADFVF